MENYLTKHEMALILVALEMNKPFITSNYLKRYNILTDRITCKFRAFKYDLSLDVSFLHKRYKGAL